MLEDVVAAVARDFAMLRIPCDVRFDKQFLAENAAPPRIVVVPTTDKFGAPVQSAGAFVATMPKGANPRPLATRYAGGEANIWAAGVVQPNPEDQLSADYKALGVLLDQFVASLQRLVPGIYSLDGGGVEQDAAVVLGHGRLYRLQFAVQVPVVAAPWDSVSGVVRQFTVQELDREVEVGVP